MITTDIVRKRSHEKSQTGPPSLEVALIIEWAAQL
jgi:hypothetical protein